MRDPQPSAPDHRRLWAPVALIVVVALVACLAGIGNDYTQDDGYLIRDNAVIHDLGNFRQFFSSPFWPPPFSPDLYRPLSSLFLSLQYAFGAGEPTIYRLVSYILYAACAVAVFALAKRLVSRNTALVIALLFAAHPVHVEAVALGVAQNELIVGLIAVLMTIRYIDRRGTGDLAPRDWIVLTVLYAAACLFKEQGFVLPGLLIAAELFVVRRDESKPIRSLTSGFAAMIVTGGVLLVVRRIVLGAVGGTFIAEALQDLGFGARVLTMLQVVPQWLRLLVFPAHLQSDYSPQEIVASHNLGAVEIIGAALLVGAALSVWFTRKSAPAIAFGIVWCGIALFPVSNLLLPTAILLAERTLFLPSIGALIALGAFAEPVLNRAFAERSRIAWSAVGAIVLLGVLRSIERERVWRNEALLAVRTVQDAPRSFRAQRAYGDILFELNQPTLAAEAYDRALALAPKDQTWRVRNDLARSYRILERRSDEAAQLELSLAQQPRQEDTRAYLVAADLALGQYAAAAAQTDSALARGGNSSVFKGLRAVADSAQRAGAPPGSVKIAINQGDRLPSR